MPASVQASYLALIADDRGNEGAAQKAVDWIDKHGAAVGLRPPNTGERLRATGSPAYLHSLQLTEVQLFNLTGNHFDPRALGHRLLQPLFALTQHPQPRQHTFPSPADALHHFADLRAMLIAEHGTRDFPLEESPFPADLLPALQATPPASG
jgi:hypothetical protein